MKIGYPDHKTLKASFVSRREDNTDFKAHVPKAMKNVGCAHRLIQMTVAERLPSHAEGAIGRRVAAAWSAT
jgi:hypothetical protein